MPTDRALGRSAFESHFGPHLDFTSDQAPKLRLAQAFDYGSEGGSLELQCTRMDPVDSNGFLSELVLSTVHEGTSSRLRRLLVRLPAGLNQPVDVQLPPNSRLERALVDARSVSPREQDGRLLFDLLSGPAEAPQRELVIDYQEPVDSGKVSRGESSIDWPTLSLPSLSTSAILDLPRSFGVFAVKQDLATTEPQGQGGGLESRFETWQQTPSLERNPAALRAFELRDRAIGPWSMTLGERLVQLDTGETPLVIDRQALEESGLGPRSRLSSSTRVGREPLDGFHDLGLEIIPIGRVLLVSTPAARPDRADGPLEGRTSREAWLSALQNAAARGSDATDRFQSVTRWRGALTPDTRPLERPGSNRLRWSKIGPPPSRFVIQTGFRGSDTAWILGIATAVLVLGIAIRGRSTALSAHDTEPGPRCRPDGRVPSSDEDCRMAVRARPGLAGDACALGRSGLETGLWHSAPPRFFDGPRTRTRTLVLRSRQGRRFGVAVAPVDRPLVADRIAPRSRRRGCRVAPILVLIPYDQMPDPSSPGPRFILRLDDFETLQALAGSATRAGAEPPISATSVEHTLEMLKEDQALLTTAYDLVCSKSGSATWTIPIGSGRDLTATLDGAVVPVRVEAEGHQAIVVIDGEGSHHLVIMRRIELVSRDSLNVPVLASALARLRIRGQVPGRRVEVNGAIGPMEIAEDQTFGYLGSVESINLRWVELDRDPEGKLGTVDGLLLWNVEPAGDRIEARLSFRSTEPRTEIRLALEPGLEVRSASFPGWRDATWERTPDHPVWVAPASPPLPDGSVVSIELWRPASVADASLRTSRSAPRIEVLEVEASSGILAVQLEPGWSARSAPAIGHDPILEDIFLRSWNQAGAALPEIETALPWTPRPELRLQAGPSPLRLSVRPSVRLDIEHGRVTFQGELACQGANVPVSEVEVTVPPTLEIISVDADGLSNWTRPAKDRLRLRFEPLGTSDRTIRIAGWIAVRSDPFGAEVRLRELPVPWLMIPGRIGGGRLAPRSTPDRRSSDPSRSDGANRLAEHNPARGPVGSPGLLLVRTDTDRSDCLERGKLASQRESLQSPSVPSRPGRLDLSCPLSVVGRPDSLDSHDPARRMGFDAPGRDASGRRGRTGFVRRSPGHARPHARHPHLGRAGTGHPGAPPV